MVAALVCASRCSSAAAGKRSGTDCSISAPSLPASPTQSYLLMDFKKCHVCFKFDEPWEAGWLDAFPISVLVRDIISMLGF